MLQSPACSINHTLLLHCNLFASLKFLKKVLTLFDEEIIVMYKSLKDYLSKFSYVLTEHFKM